MWACATLLAVLLTSGLVAVPSATAQDALPFSENWESGSIDTDIWNKFGDPSPIVKDVGFESDYGFAPNGDGFCDSGAVTYQTFPAENIAIDWYAKLGGTASDDIQASLMLANNDRKTGTCGEEGDEGQRDHVLRVSLKGNNYDSRMDVDLEGQGKVYEEKVDPSWHHLRIELRSSDTVEVYLDGSLVYSTTHEFSVDQFRLQLGERSGGSRADGIQAYLDEIQMTELPIASDDSGQTTLGHPVETDVLANDSDPDGSLEPSTVEVQSGPSDGTTTVNDDGTITYTPNDGFTGEDSYTYTVKDDDGAESNEATVTVVVEDKNLVSKVGIFNGNEYYISEPGVARNWNEARSIADSLGGHLVTLSDQEEEEFILNNVENTEKRDEGWTGLTDRENEGDFKWVTGEEVTYTNWCSGEPNDIGTEDAVVLRLDNECWNDADIVNDNRGFVIEIEANELPVAERDSAATTEEQSVTTDVLANDTDEDGNLDPSTATVENGPSNGTATANSDGTITYTPEDGFAGTDSYTYTVKDDDGAESNQAKVTIEVNARPQASANEDTTTEGMSVETDVLANDSDPDGDGLDASSVQVESQPSDGSASSNSDGTITYAPDEDFREEDSYTYTVADSEGARSEAATVTIEVNAVPTASFTVDPSVPRGGQEVTFDAGGSSDPDGQVQSYEWTFGDGSSGSGPQPTHTYQDTGTYTAGLTVTDSDGAVSEEATAEIQVRPGQMQARATRSFGGGQKEDYRLVALPGQADATLSETASGDWRGFRETGARGSQAYSRSECSGGCQFGPGKGFWLIAGQAWQVDRTVQTVDLSGDGTVQIDLQDGWNVVSNPLEEKVSWSLVQQATGTEQPLWKYSGGWSEASTFQSAKSGQAYYFRDDQISALTVPYPEAGGASARGKATQGTPQAKADTAQVEDGARRALTLSVVRGGEAVTSVTAGVRPEAKPGLDRYDLYGPPGYFGPATLRLMQRPSAEGSDKERHVALAAEYREPGGDGHTFDLRLRAVADTVLTLRAGGLGGFEGEQVSLVENATGEAHALQEGEEITILQRTAEARYRLLVGSESYVEEKKENLRPSEVKLLPSYPNPFSGQTTIEYALPRDSEVRLSVYDVLGRRVATLADGRKEGGFHQVQWQAGGGLSSGVYFLQLRAGGEKAVRRVTLIR